jgi:ribosomal protein S18 acetylase RimI-like enzyme
VTDVEYRAARAADAPAVASLHADSWRRHYGGAYAAEFLAGPVVEDRLAVWMPKLAEPGPNDLTIVGYLHGELAGFAHTVLGEDARWGALLDNLHVRFDLKGSGIGTELMARTAAAVLERSPASGLYLWVLEQNTAAQAFYRARGAEFADSREIEPPGGGTVVGVRCVWPDPSTLLRSAL